MISESIHSHHASSQPPTAACVHCTRDMEPSHMFGDLRYYVCRPCNAWSIPYPPEPVPTLNLKHTRCVSAPVGVPYVDEAS
jgi:hypothetical protein